MFIQDCDGSEEGSKEKEEGPFAKLDLYMDTPDGWDRGQVDRRLLVRMLRKVVEAGADTMAEDISNFIYTVQEMADHSEAVVRSSLMEQVPHLAVVCDEEKSKLSRVEAELLPLVLRMQHDMNSQVRKASQAALLVLMEEELVQQQTVEQHICPAVLGLTDVWSHPELHGSPGSDCGDMTGSSPVAVSAIALMIKMAPLIGQYGVEEFFLERFTDLCRHDDASYREICAGHFGDFSAVLGTEVTEKNLVGVFLSLCQDCVWSVRMACADVFVSVASICSLATRRGTLCLAFARLLTDSMQWVRASAYQMLGAFICTFAESCVVGLAYDQQGDLVLVNRHRDEFKFSLKAPQYPRTDGGKFFYCDNTMRLTVGQPETQGMGPCVTLPELSHLLKGCHPVKQEETDEDGGAFNTFNFWRFPVPELLAAPAPAAAAAAADEDDVIKAEMKSLDHELSSLSEKLAKCSTSELSSLATSTKTPSFGNSESSESVISSVSRVSPDSGWGSVEAEVTPPGASIALLSPQHIVNKAVNTSRQDVVPQLLLDHYVCMTHPAHVEMTDKEITQYCAHSLPGVAYTLGRDNWLLIREVYIALCNDVQWKVRRTLASSIHELVNILGEDLAMRDLAPVFRGFLADLDEVRIGALQHLFLFFQSLRRPTRHGFLPLLKKFLQTDNDRNWRFREELAHQLMQCVSLFHAEDFVHHVGVIAAELLSDRVAAVRHKAVAFTAHLVLHLTWVPPLRTSYLTNLIDLFAVSESWLRRQTFVLLCSRLSTLRVLDQGAFHEQILPSLLALSKDPVCNVRLCVARCLAQDCVASGYISNNCMDWETVQHALSRLSNDVDRDVRYLACQQNNPPSPDHTVLSLT